VVLGGAEPRVERGVSPFATTLERDTDAIRFDPTAPIPPLRDPGTLGCPPGELRQRIATFLEKALLPHCARALADPGSLAASYHCAGVVYEIEVVFPDESRVWTFDFRSAPPQLREGRSPLANVVHRIAASALVAWIERHASWFTVRAYSRRFATLARISRSERGARVQPLAPPDLLMQFLVYDAADSADSARRRIDHEITALRRRSREHGERR
jgi:hypothetical protein